MPSEQIYTSALIYTSIPALCFFVGGFIGIFLKPNESFTSAFQHFAAGIVFAAVAVELVPYLGHSMDRLSLGIGFIIGVAVMLFIKILFEQIQNNANESTRFPYAMLIAIIVDIFIDGMLIGIALEAGKSGGTLVAIALAVEIFFLGLSTTATFTKRSVEIKKQLPILFGCALFVPLGGIAATVLLTLLPQSFMHGFIAFGIAALLYLVTEELLIEAHEVKERPWITASFFLGFLIILLLEF